MPIIKISSIFLLLLSFGLSRAQTVELPIEKYDKLREKVKRYELLKKDSIEWVSANKTNELLEDSVAEMTKRLLTLTQKAEESDGLRQKITNLEKSITSYSADQDKFKEYKKEKKELTSRIETLEAEITELKIENELNSQKIKQSQELQKELTLLQNKQSEFDKNDSLLKKVTTYKTELILLSKKEINLSVQKLKEATDVSDVDKLLAHINENLNQIKLVDEQEYKRVKESISIDNLLDNRLAALLDKAQTATEAKYNHNEIQVLKGKLVDYTKKVPGLSSTIKSQINLLSDYCSKYIYAYESMEIISETEGTNNKINEFKDALNKVKEYPYLIDQLKRVRVEANIGTMNKQFTNEIVLLKPQSGCVNIK